MVIGQGIPEGKTAYVLERAEDKTIFYHPLTGDRFPHDNPHCPLKVVGCVFNADNVWANIQPYEDPARMSFNFLDGKSWRPFFAQGKRKPELMSVQSNQLIYRETSAQMVRKLQKDILSSCKAKFESWRPTSTTTWNR